MSKFRQFADNAVRDYARYLRGEIELSAYATGTSKNHVDVTKVAALPAESGPPPKKTR
jgi:hypothetical protein